jgi:hypothetical protein
MSKVQGWRWVEEKDWVEGGDEGPQWVNDAPLTRKQKQQLRMGTIRAIKPARCEPTALLDGGPVTSQWSKPDYLQAAGYSKRVLELTSNNVLRDNLVFSWSALARVLPPGAAEQWVTNAINMIPRCRTYTQISADGDIAKNRFIGQRFYSTGDAYLVWNDSKTAAGTLRMLTFAEPIGNVLYTTTTFLSRPTKAGVNRVFEVYNVLAGNVAEAQGITREAADVDGMTRFRPSPDRFKPLTPPASSIT